MKKQKLLNGSQQQNLLFALGGIGILALARGLYRQAIRYDFKDKVVLITGGSRGLGLEMARILAQKGAKIAICSRTRSQLEKAEKELRELGAEVFAVAADLTVEDDARQLAEQTIGYFGHIDVLINNAGTMLVAPDNVLETADYRKVMEANLWSAVHMVKFVVPHFKSRGVGRIANICSIGGKIAVPHMLPYSVSKFALTGFSEGLAGELGKDNIKVTTVVPNLMRTGSPRNTSLKGDHEAEYAWFKISDSLPGLSQNAEKAAKEIVEAISLGQKEIILTPIAKLVTGMQGLAPGAVATLSEWVNHMMPESDNTSEKKGHESESDVTSGMAAQLTDEAASRNNEAT